MCGAFAALQVGQSLSQLYREDAQQVLQAARRSLKELLEGVDLDAKPPKVFSRCSRDDLLRFCRLTRWLARLCSAFWCVAHVVSVFLRPGETLLQLDLVNEKKQKLQEVMLSLNQNDQGAAEAEAPAGSTAAGFLLTGLSFLFTWNVGVLADPG